MSSVLVWIKPENCHDLSDLKFMQVLVGNVNCIGRRDNTNVENQMAVSHLEKKNSKNLENGTS